MPRKDHEMKVGKKRKKRGKKKKKEKKNKLFCHTFFAQKVRALNSAINLKRRQAVAPLFIVYISVYTRNIEFRC